MQVAPLDTVDVDEPCPVCGSKVYMVDGDGAGRWWLLCFDPGENGCLNTRDLPATLEVVACN